MPPWSLTPDEIRQLIYLQHGVGRQPLQPLTCHRTFIQRRLDSPGFVRQAARVEQRTIGGAGRGAVSGLSIAVRWAA